MQQAQQNTSALFGRPGWTYVTTVRGPARGPQPRLARGTGRTGGSALPTGGNLPGYVANNEYDPSLWGYQPKDRANFLLLPPQTTPAANNGRELVGTYQPHDFAPGQRFLHHMRRAENWQVTAFPPNYRNLFAWQQVQKYRVLSHTLSARPLPQENYFLGYIIDPSIAAKIGQTGIGYMGSQ
jgi:hypothetical protein